MKSDNYVPMDDLERIVCEVSVDEQKLEKALTESFRHIADDFDELKDTKITACSVANCLLDLSRLRVRFDAKNEPLAAMTEILAAMTINYTVNSGIEVEVDLDLITVRYEIDLVVEMNRLMSSRGCRDIAIGYADVDCSVNARFALKNASGETNEHCIALIVDEDDDIVKSIKIYLNRVEN